MANLKNTILALIDSGASQAKNLVEDFNDLVNSFDWDSHIDYFTERKNELLKMSGDLLSNFHDLMKQVSNDLADFSVTVPFDESLGEKLSYEVKDGKLHIEVSYEDENTTRSNKTSVLLPKNCDLDNISKTLNALAKTVTITVPKIVEGDEYTSTTEVQPKPKKKVVKKKKTDYRKVSSKLEEKLNENVSKYSKILKRDNRGRFTRREPKANA